MHRKLLPVCLEGKYVAIVQQTPSTQKIQKRDLLIVQNIHSQFFYKEIGTSILRFVGPNCFLQLLNVVYILH